MKASAASKTVWGLWQIEIDTRSWEVALIPLRGAQYTVDVVTFLQPPSGNPANMQIKVTDVSNWISQGLIGVVVGLTHPFPGFAKFTGFDVTGVFIAPGTLAGTYDPDTIRTNGVIEPVLQNPDGYTRWMNPTEFPSNGTIFSFKTGKLGTPNVSLFTSTINGFKYFVDGLSKDGPLEDFYSSASSVNGRGTFQAGSTNWREYDLKFPIQGGSPQLIFQYAVVADWIEPDPSLSGDPTKIDVPSDFPLEANAGEAIYLRATDHSDLHFDGSSGYGSIRLSLEVYDWGALAPGVKVSDQIYRIVIESPTDTIPSGYATFGQATLAATASAGSSLISSVFEIEIANCAPKSLDDVPLLITVESQSPDTFDPGNGQPANDDRLASYFLSKAAVTQVTPTDLKVISPNGGETLWMAMTREIMWETGPGGITNVAIEWSTDGFVSDIRTIVADTSNDGSFLWSPIPNVPTLTARVRVRDLAGTGADASDANLKIALPVWLDFEPEMTIGLTNVTWHVLFWPYEHSGFEFSPAISQDTDGMAHVVFYDTYTSATYGEMADDVAIRSTTGTSWEGVVSIFGTTGAKDARFDSGKIAPGSEGKSWVGITIPVGFDSIYGCDADRFLDFPAYYTYNGLKVAFAAGRFAEIATDKAGYVYFFADNQVADNIFLRKSLQPGLYGYGYEGMGSIENLTANGLVSQSRSWARQNDALAMIFTTPSGEVRLAETTDAPANTTWDASEVVWSPGGGLVDAHNPALCCDSTGRLFAIWVVVNSDAVEYRILASMRATPSGPWSAPVTVATSSGDFYDIHITSAQVLLPTDTTEDVALVAWQNAGIVSAAISPLDLLAFLPAVDVTAPGVKAQDPDVLCMDPSSSYFYDVLFAYSWKDATDWDVAIRNADFVTP